MKSGRCLGLIGGLGVGATVHYYETLAKTHEALGRALNIVITHAQIGRLREYVEANDRDGLAEYLISFIRRMKAAGAEIAAIPAVTPHMCVRELIAASPLPIFNIFEPLVDEFRTRATRRAAIFGTRFVIESGFFGFAGNIEIVKPRVEEVDFIHETYMELAQRGKGTRKQHDQLTALAHTLLEREGVDTIVFAGTDLVLVFNDTNTSFSFVDCAALHIAAITNGLVS